MQGPERCTTAATRHPGWPPASASGPPSSLASSSTFDKGAEGPGRPRRASAPPRARPAGTAARGLLSVGRAPRRRTGNGAEGPRTAASPTCRDRSRRWLRCTDPTTCHQDCHPPPSPARPPRRAMPCRALPAASSLFAPSRLRLMCPGDVVRRGRGSPLPPGRRFGGIVSDTGAARRGPPGPLTGDVHLVVASSHLRAQTDPEVEALRLCLAPFRS